uniref:H-NS family nucleoid-associated regulatory protein n=1 Tax=Belnapia moabensis TaxID=365533 RepID=UPI001B809ECD
RARNTRHRSRRMRLSGERGTLTVSSFVQQSRFEELPLLQWIILPRRARLPVRAEYRHTETGETWSGRGSAPAWLKNLEEQGRRREEFVIDAGI